MKTLVVDDELVSRKKMQRIMDGFGECEAVESGSAAIAAFEKAWESWLPFDLITLDIAMPEMDGIELLYAIREIEKEKKIPKEKQVKILMVTSHSDRDSIITSIQAECDDYIVKPFDRETVIEKIEKIKSGERIGRADIEDIMTSPPDMRVRKMKTLVVDDELVSRKKMQRIMDGFGEYEAVESGSAAIAAFKNALETGTPFDLITLDIAMPGMDGTAVLYEIREIEKEKKIPKEKQVKILMVTSHSDRDTIITCIQAGCDDYIVKPFDREIVAKKLEKFGLKA
ncbi:MAG: response regulator [Deltaproteobacteria bacterium]|nr:response regulator [Deltaproteobacteria bacterium]